MGSFDAEWAQIKKEVATAGVTRLASAKDGGGGNPGGVQSAPEAWRTAAQGVEGLVAKVKAAETGIAGQADRRDGDISTNVAMYDAASRVSDTWTDYLARVQRRCTALGRQLAMAGDIQARNDQQTGEELRRYHLRDEQRLTDGFNGLDDGPGYADSDYIPGPVIPWEV